MAIELISTIKPKNNGSFPIVESNDIKGGYYSVENVQERDNIPLGRRLAGMLCYVKGDKIYKLDDTLQTWEEFTVAGTGEVKSNEIWIGTTPPTIEGIKIWIDTSDETLDETFSSSVIDEFKNILTSLTNRVIQLEKEVEYLKANGGGGGVPPEDPNPPVTTSDNILTFEDGSILTFEDDSILIFEKVSTGTPTNDTIMSFEDNSVLTFEDGSIMCFDIGDNSPETYDTIITNELGETLIFEEGSIMTFEVAS